ncbi:WS/DGAT/MGAT family O-acyltransferase [Brumicola nitratireducens]|uniref:diacylglycerol O-acyltransferase n=1 Tax=Glaciecola nitratireducens (strain JCM 12485 / KCTC 12276 / FR1064) TaxID=1085623 RepID=G4QL22_GLANF|nr:wax ester/triacylglycerol synthase family O-acyltransferase [Glaciecola nitratireducens]AEP29412.1 diacylglycerol acyltransferase [Glaciecola nitratireducens FR1064]
MSNKLNALDLAFLSLEKQSTPVNVASLTIFEIPKNYKGNFPLDLLAKLQSQVAKPPFNQKLSSVHSAALPSWELDTNFDIHHHVRHSALPLPGKLDDLLELTSRLHSQLLDRKRPLWEFHLIEGLEHNQFAMYLKMHHAVIDGMGGIELMENWFSLYADEEIKAPWACMPNHRKSRGFQLPGLLGKTSQLAGKIAANSKMVQGLSKMIIGQGLKAIGLDNNMSPVPFSAPHSMFNVPITGSRCFVVKTLSLTELEALGKQANATINDIILALCSGALRRYLMEKRALPNKSLIASVPVSVRQARDLGNQITYVMANLATDEPDTMTRLAMIGQSTQDAKRELADVSAAAATNFAFLAQGAVAVMNQLNISSIIPPAANIIISNVPGPRKPLYFGQAKLKATYPLSVLVDGQALNITVVSYCDVIGFGLMACSDIIPDVSLIANYIESGIDDIKGGIYLRNLMQEAKS